MNKYLSTRVSVRGLSVLPHVRIRVCQGVPTHRYKVWAGGSGPGVGGAGVSLCVEGIYRQLGCSEQLGFHPLDVQGFLESAQHSVRAS